MDKRPCDTLICGLQNNGCKILLIDQQKSLKSSLVSWKDLEGTDYLTGRDVSPHPHPQMECPVFDPKLHLMVILLFRFGDCEVLLQ